MPKCLETQTGLKGAVSGKSDFVYKRSCQFWLGQLYSAVRSYVGNV